MQVAFFKFFQSLNDFLSHAGRNELIKYGFSGNPAIKDAIEAIGIPHTEVDAIVVNGSPVDFSYKLNNNDKVDVYPLNDHPAFTKNNSLIPAHIYPLVFVADVHLGKLVKALRILGFDISYQNNYSDKLIVERAEKENRIVLTRDIGLLKHRSIKWGYWLRSQQVDKQCAEVSKHFNLSPEARPFTRCLACNGLIETVPKEIVSDKIPPKTHQYFKDFFQCSSCKRVYWKGSHYENMVIWLYNFRNGRV